MILLLMARTFSMSIFTTTFFMFSQTWLKVLKTARGWDIFISHSLWAYRWAISAAVSILAWVSTSNMYFTFWGLFAISGPEAKWASGPGILTSLLLSHTHRFQGQVVCIQFMPNQAWHFIECWNSTIFSVQLYLSCQNFMECFLLFIIQVMIIRSCNNIWKRKKKKLSSRKHNIPLETCFSLHRLRVYNLVPRFVALKNKVNFGVESWSCY